MADKREQEKIQDMRQEGGSILYVCDCDLKVS